MSLSEELFNFSKLYTLEGDVIRCKICKRAVHYTLANMEFIHDANCTNTMKPHPWRYLQHLSLAVFTHPRPYTPTLPDL